MVDRTDQVDDDAPPSSRSVRRKQNKAPDSSRVWNSLEITKLVTSASTPLMVALVGALLASQTATQAQNAAKQRDALAFEQAKQDKLNARFASIVDKRAAVWDKMGPDFVMLDDFRAHASTYLYMGANLAKNDVIVARAHADSLQATLGTYSPYFSPPFRKTLSDFISDSDKLTVITNPSAPLTMKERQVPAGQIIPALKLEAGNVRSQLAAELGVDR